LKILGISSILIDFNLVDKQLFYPIPKNELGRNIFIFNGQHKGRGHIYKQCFIMIRLTSHDGNANSVQEYEAMGIPVIHNQSDYKLQWENVDDIV